MRIQPYANKLWVPDLIKNGLTSHSSTSPARCSLCCSPSGWEQASIPVHCGWPLPRRRQGCSVQGGLGGHIIPTLSGCYLGVGKNKPVSILPTGVLEVRFSRFSQLDDLQVIIRGTQTGKGIFTENLGVTLSEMPDIGHPV